MFVFKAAVVGAGTMGGEIAHAIANSDIPVVLKDVDQKFVDAGLEKARSLWQGRVDQGKLSEEERDRKLTEFFRGRAQQWQRRRCRLNCPCAHAACCPA